MNGASMLVLVILFSLVAFAVWRNWKKGTPCQCGCGGCGKCGACGK